MKTLYTNTWRTTALAVCSAFLLLCSTTVNAQTTFGPFASTATVDLTPNDGLYDGTFGSMASSQVAVSGVTGDNVIDITVDVAISHTWEGDLVLKLESPDGAVLTLTSRPGLAETLDDGLDCCGNSSGMDGATLTFSDAGVTDGEELGLFGENNSGETICSQDGLCSYFPSPGATTESATSFADFFDETMNGDWTLYVGDAGNGDVGVLDSWSITIVTASPSFTLLKTVNLEDGNGDCLDDAVPTTQSIGVNVGDGVCYWYTAVNTGDIDLDLLDLMDDQLLPGGATGLAGFELAVGSSLAIPWSSAPTIITAEVTNIVTISYTNIETGLVAGPETDEATVGIIPNNDVCADAIALDCGTPLTGTTAFSTDFGNPATCGVFEDDLGVWYTFVGDGGVAQITTCGSVSETSGVQPWLAIYDGTCGAENCVVSGSAADADCGTGNGFTLEAQTVAGTTYFVYVAAINGFPEVLDFNITLNCLPPVNDLCAEAFAIECGDVVAGNTDSATDTDASACDSDGLGVWFSFVGNGDIAVLDLSNSDYDTYLGVTETCGGACFASDDDGGDGLTSALSFLTVDQQTYYVQVSGFSTSTGNYELSFECITPEPNDLCSGAIHVECDDVVTGDLSLPSVTEDNMPNDCGISIGASLWYHFVGNGQDVTFSTCGGTADTELSVYTGDCGALVCEDSNDDADCGLQSEVTLFTVAGEEYYINVAYWAGGNPTAGNGDFELAITCNCTADAGTITADASPVCLISGTATITATHDGNSVVPTDYLQMYVLTDAATGVILDFGATASFDVTAAGDYVIHTAIYDPLQFDPATVTPGTTIAQINAMTIDGGGNMCASVDLVGAPITVNQSPSADFTFAQVGFTLDVDFTDASSNLPTSWAWDFDGLGASGNQNPTYTFPSTGSYLVELTATNACGSDVIIIEVTVMGPPPANDLCADAIHLECDDVVTGNTEFATEDNSDGCNGGTTGRGVWYHVVGNDMDITVSLCNVTAFDSEINVFEGSCGTLTCVGGNDDDPVCSPASAFTFTAASGVGYYIYVSDYISGGSNFGDFELAVTCAATPPPLANDDCAGAEELVVGATCVTVEGDVDGATESMPGCLGTATDDVWFSFVATAADATVEVTGSTDFDAVFEVFSDACGSLVSEECVDETGDAGLETVGLTELSVGNTYYIRVYDWYTAFPATTTFDICVYSDVPVGISGALSNNLSIYPNPSNGEFVIEVNGVDAAAVIEVMDMTGRVVHAENVTLNGNFRKTMNLDVAKGTYLLQIATVEGVVTRKIQIH